ncbi:hypothetical protein ACVWXS_003561 [Lysinibacillus sp. TE18511]
MERRLGDSLGIASQMKTLQRKRSAPGGTEINHTLW